MLKYKGYSASVDVDFDAGIIIGRVLDLRDVLTFEGATPAEAEKAFRFMIDQYLAHCRETGREPARPFSGTFSLRITPDLHKRIAIAAADGQKSLNQWVIDALERYLLDAPSGSTGSTAMAAKTRHATVRAPHNPIA